MTLPEAIKLLVAITFVVTGQVPWKLGLTEIGGFSLAKGLMDSITKIATNPKIVIGLVLYLLTTLIYLDVLAKLPLSLVYPFMSLSYVLALIPAYFILGESITWPRIMSVFIIWSGLVLLVKS